MSSQAVRTSYIEVERKFVPSDLLQAQLDGRYGDYERLRRQQEGSRTAQQSNALSFFRLPDKEIKDKYFDCRDQLSKQGVWIRHRTTRTIQTADFPLVNDSKPNSQWEAKLRMGGNYTSSQMIEAFDVDNMKEIASIYLSPEGVKHIEAMAELKTTRKTYVVQKPFGWDRQTNAEGEIRVVFDEVTAGAEKREGEGQGGGEFNHVVGEVELTAEVKGGESNGEHDWMRRQETARMQARLDEFIKRHEIIFPKDGVKGKLEAFFEWKEEQGGFGALV